MASLPVDFPGLAAQEAQCDQAGELLAKAARVCSATVPGERWNEQAERLSQAAVYVGVALTEIQKSIGWYQAASAANDAGLLTTEENES